MKKDSPDRKTEEYREKLKEQLNPLSACYRHMTEPDTQDGRNGQEYGAAAREGADSSGPVFRVFYRQGGQLSGKALEQIDHYYRQHPDCLILYGDEDEILKKGADERKEAGRNCRAQTQSVTSDGCAEMDGCKVCNPWLKPDWSPDTFQSFFYFGNLFAVRTCAGTEDFLEQTEKWMAQGILEKQGQADRGRVVLFTFTESARKPLWEHLKILTGRQTGRNFAGHVQRILYHGSGSADWEEKLQFPNTRLKKQVRVSLVIPSKDHPELVAQCLTSIRKTQGMPDREQTLRQNRNSDAGGCAGTKMLSYEIILVDNGSSPANKAKLEELQQEIPFLYHYEPMEFNFSRMCNRGAELAGGEVICFLNDDITVSGSDWLEILTAQALCPQTGAVGAKLYYPGGCIIQHAGITNMSAGPVHKLGGMEDLPERNYYHNRNRAVYNVLAVTGAALAVEKSKFMEAGGFCEELAVAYNDVEFGFKLYEKGYYNVQRNDVCLYHHESVSRGADKSMEKERRLLRERALLYRLHPDLKGRDPFYHPYLIQFRLDADFHVEPFFDYDTKDSQVTVLPGERKARKKFLRKLLRKGPEAFLSIDCIKDEETILIEGWGSLSDRPAAGRTRTLLLKGKKHYAVTVYDKYRPDTRTVLTGQPDYELSGFVARIRKEEVESGIYEIGMEFMPGVVLYSNRSVNIKQ